MFIGEIDVERVIQSDDEIVTFHVKESFKQIVYGHQPFVSYIFVTNYGDFCVVGSAQGIVYFAHSS